MPRGTDLCTCHCDVFHRPQERLVTIPELTTERWGCPERHQQAGLCFPLPGRRDFLTSTRFLRGHWSLRQIPRHCHCCCRNLSRTCVWIQKACSAALPKVDCVSVEGAPPGRWPVILVDQRHLRGDACPEHRSGSWRQPALRATVWEPEDYPGTRASSQRRAQNAVSVLQKTYEASGSPRGIAGPAASDSPGNIFKNANSQLAPETCEISHSQEVPESGSHPGQCRQAGRVHQPAAPRRLSHCLKPSSHFKSAQ